MTTPHSTLLDGGNALSAFRARQLIARLADAGIAVGGLTAHFVHLVGWDAEPGAEGRERMAALLNYGEPAPAPPRGKVIERVLVAPRLGTVSPWASKATDIARNCGIAAVHRVERLVEYQATSAKPHTVAASDAMTTTETVYVITRRRFDRNISSATTPENRR